MNENNHEEENRLNPETPESYDNEQPEDLSGQVEAGPSTEDRLVVMQQELDQAKEQMLRALADTENTRKRLLREREDIRKYALSDFARDLLAFSDNFRRALDSIPAELKDVDDRIRAVIDGVESMEKELLKTFDKHGIKKIEPLDEPFNPNYHEVMFEAPVPGKAGGTIIQLIEPGYMLHDRLLRPARVGVAKDDGQGKGNGEHKIDTTA